MKRNLREDWAADLNRTSEQKWDDLKKAIVATKQKVREDLFLTKDIDFFCA